MNLTKTKSTPLVFILLFISAFSSNIEKSASIATTPSFEKLYLHFDKPYYYAGEDIWFKVYLVDAKTNKSDTLSQVVYVDLISPDNKIVDSKTINVNEDGGFGDFRLSVHLINGEYAVRAYTNFMRNFDTAYFFRKKIHINSLYLEENSDNESQIKESIDLKTNDINLKPDVQFFPEGGYLVNSLLGKVGFKAIGVDGKGIDVSGVITDNTGKEVQKIKSLKFGLGMFKFLPEAGKKYYANIIYYGKQHTYELPAPLINGVVMEVEELTDSYTVSVISSLPNGVNNFKFIGIQRGLVVVGTEINGNEVKAKIIVPKSNLKQGIVQFTLFDSSDAPLCERLVFLESNESNPKITISPSKETYGKRSLVELEISSEQVIQQKINANMSITVTDLSAVEPDNYGMDIKSYLLLNSELKGEIEHPNYYFKSEDPKRKEMLDILMMTQGWRQFIWNEHRFNKDNELKFDYEKGISISGNVKSFFNHKKSAVVDASITVTNDNKIIYDEVKTNEEGHFEFKDLEFFDSTTVIIQAKKIKKNDTWQKNIKNPIMNYFIEMDSFVAPEINIKKSSSKPVDKDFDKGYLIKLNEKHYYDSINADMKDRILLKEVELETVIARREKQMDDKRLLYKNPSHTLDFEDVKIITINPLLALQGRIPGLVFYGPPDSISIRMRGNTSFVKGSNSPLILVDGMSGYTEKEVSEIPISDIDFIDVLKGAKATIYGSRGANGVIAIYTLTGREDKFRTETRERNGIINFKHSGYYKARRFYEPNYNINKPAHDKLDDRTTIYWNPNIKLNEQGKIIISFYSADISTTYRVDIEGLTSEGGFIKSEMFFDIKD